MEMSGERTIAASPGDVWAALNDPKVLMASISGCESMEKTSDTSFEAVVIQKVGPVKARFTGEVELSDIVPGQSYRITGRGKGGAAGGATGGAHVVLAPAEGGTLLTYEAEAKVTGKIAQLGSRLISGFAKKMADDFFDRFKEQVEGTDADGAEGVIAGAATGAAAAGAAVAEDAAAAVQSQVDRMEDASRDVAADMSEAVDSAGESIKAETADAKDRFDAVSDQLDEQTRGFAEEAGKVVDNVTAKIGETASDVYYSARDAVSDVFEKGEDGKSKFDEATESVDERTRGVAKDLAGPVDRVTGAIEEVWDDVAEAVKDGPPAKKSWWKRLFGG